MFSVENLGLLQSSSCFSCEDYNADLRNLFHGTHHIALQVMQYVSYNKSQKLPQFFHINIKNLCFLKNSISSHVRFKHLIEEISGTTSAIGLLKSFIPVVWERSVIYQFICHLDDSCQFQRLLPNK